MPFSMKAMYWLQLRHLGGLNWIPEEVSEVNEVREGRRSLCVSSCSCTEDTNVVTWVSSPISRAVKGGSYQNCNSAVHLKGCRQRRVMSNCSVVPHLIWNFTKNHLFSFLLKHFLQFSTAHWSAYLDTPCIFDVPLESLPFTCCS